MPTVSIDLDFTHCPICKKEFKEPKALPCLHTFCQVCLQDDIDRRQQLCDRVLTGFPCSVCRAHIPPPDSDTPVCDWAKGFITNFHITKLMDKTKLDHFLNVGCQSCLRLKKRRLASSWCLNCQEALCVDCTETHKLFAVRSTHEIKPLSIMDVKKLGRQTTEAICQVHGSEFLNLFCERCEKVLCNSCYVHQHRKCDRVVPIKDVLREKKENSLKLKRGLEIKKREAEMFVCDVLQRKDYATEQRDMIVREIKCVRQSLEKLLEEKERDSIEQLEKLYAEQQDNLDELLKLGESLLNSLSTSVEYLRSSSDADRDADFLHVYQSVKSAVSRLWNPTTATISDKLNRSISFVPNSNFIYCFRKLKEVSLGDSVLLDNGVWRRLSDASDDSTSADDNHVITKWILTAPVHQYMAVSKIPPTKMVSKITEFSAKVDSDASCQIDDLVLLRDGNLLVTDWSNEKVKKFTQSGELLDELLVGSWPCRICNLTDDRVVITLPRTKEISYLCHKGPLKMTKMVTENRYYGVTTLHGGLLACSTYSPPKIDILTIRAEILTSITNDLLKKPLLLWPHYLTTTLSGDLLISDFCGKCLICIEVNTEKINFVHRSTGENPFCPGGIDVGQDGAIYVVDSKENKIYNFSADGELVNVFLTPNDGRSKQMGLAVSSSGVLFVTEEAPSDNLKTYLI